MKKLAYLTALLNLVSAGFCMRDGNIIATFSQINVALAWILVAPLWREHR